MPKVILYHGTQDASLDTFREDGIGLGADPNSALGVFFCEYPSEAVRYADPDFADTRDAGRAIKGAKVIIAEVDLARALVVSSTNQFFGIDETGIYDKTHVDFAAARQRLLEEGYDCVVSDGVIDECHGIWVVLDPKCITVTDSMTVNVAETADTLTTYEHVAMEGGGVLFPVKAPIPSP